MAKIKIILIKFFSLLIRIYQVCFSRFFPLACRFHPSCSVYALDALRIKGPFVGFYLILNRLFRCHPWNEGGLDPVEPKEEKKTWI